MNESKKLTLSRETLRCLDDEDLMGIVGGGGQGDRHHNGGGNSNDCNNNSNVCSGFCISADCQSVGICDSVACYVLVG
jgi:hypothetical protein